MPFIIVGFREIIKLLIKMFYKGEMKKVLGEAIGKKANDCLTFVLQMVTPRNATVPKINHVIFFKQ